MKVTAGDGVRLVDGRLDLSRRGRTTRTPTADRAPRGARSAHTADQPPRPARRGAQLTGFTSHSTHAANADPRMVDLQRHLHAALLAWSLNIGPTRMAEGDCTSVRRHVTAPSRRRALRSTDRLHQQGEPSGAAPIGVDTSASAGLRHKRGRPARGPRPAFVLRRNSTTARQETRFARISGLEAGRWRHRRRGQRLRRPIRLGLNRSVHHP